MANPSIRPDFAPHVGDEWQANCSDMGQAVGHLFLNPLGADIYFVPLLNASDPPKKYLAHKVLLMARSSVLSAQFHYDNEKKKAEEAANRELSELVENQNDGGDSAPEPKKPKSDYSSGKIQEIELHSEPEAFEQFLRFCYMDKAEITAENALSLLYIANRYSVRPLVKKAIQFICENIKVENVFEMLEFSIKFDYDGIKEVEKSALEIIRNKTVEVLKTEAFLEISPETLEFLMINDCFVELKEVDIFKKLIRRAQKQQTIAGNEGKSLRELLGPALFQIRFWQMNFRDFGRFVVPTNVLTDAEIAYIFTKLSIQNDYETFYGDPKCPFPPFKIRRGIRTLTLDIKNFREFAATETALLPKKILSEPFGVDGFTFCIAARKNDNFPEHLGIYVRCNDLFFGDGSENWSCCTNLEFSVVSKKPNKANAVGPDKHSHRFQAKKNSHKYHGYANFTTFSELLDPANGWIENDTVTVRARIDVVKEEDMEENGDSRDIPMPLLP